MKAYVFPGQGAQFEGMGKDLYDTSEVAKARFEQANELMGFSISEVMFNGSAEELRQTKVTQPAIFLHSVIKAELLGDDFQPALVAGHSFGEFSALVASGALGFEEGLTLVKQRAMAMQKACEAVEGTMAAIIGMKDEEIEQICAGIDEVVVPANYNSPGQLVISGSLKGVELAVEQLKEAGALKWVMLSVGGAFHSPLMEPARQELATAIEAASISAPRCPIYQNVVAQPITDPETIKANLIAQLTAPVRWTQSMQQMIADGVKEVIEVGGKGKILTGLFRRIDRKLPSSVV